MELMEFYTNKEIENLRNTIANSKYINESVKRRLMNTIDEATRGGSAGKQAYEYAQELISIAKMEGAIEIFDEEGGDAMKFIEKYIDRPYNARNDRQYVKGLAIVADAFKYVDSDLVPREIDRFIDKNN